MASQKINSLVNGTHLVAYLLLALLALLVPLFDRKLINAIAALFVLSAFLWLTMSGRSTLRQWDAIDGSMLALLVSAILSTYFGWPAEGRYHGVAEAASHLALFLYLRHGRHSEMALEWMAAAVIVGTTLAALLSLVSHVPGSPFQLPGVRGSIRSALYTGITLMLCLGLALHFHGIRRYVALGLVFFLITMVLSMASRAVSIGLVICLIIGSVAHFRKRASNYALIGIVASMIAFALQPNSTIEQSKAKAQELIELLAAGNISPNDQARMEIWRTSWAWIKRGEHVLFGIGPRNYHLIDKDRLELTPPLQFETTRQSSHAHNLFLTRYIEQGLVGLTALIALLFLIARQLWHDGIRQRTGWAWWAALGGWLLPMISGLVGSPWNHDYVWLAVFTFALYEATRSPMHEKDSPASKMN